MQAKRPAVIDNDEHHIAVLRGPFAALRNAATIRPCTLGGSTRQKKDTAALVEVVLCQPSPSQRTALRTNSLASRSRSVSTKKLMKPPAPALVQRCLLITRFNMAIVAVR